MGRIDARIVFGALLVLLGLLLLLQNLNLLPPGIDLLWAFLFALGGMAFIALALNNREHWWAWIPGFTLLGLGALVALQAVSPGAARVWGASLFLGGIGLGFWAVYLVQRRYWWPIIPGGALISLAATTAITELIGGQQAGVVFLGGLAITFLLAYLLPTNQPRPGWALIPAAALALIAITASTALTFLSPFIWPILLILAGLYLLLRSRRPR